MKSEINLLSPEARDARMQKVIQHRMHAILTACITGAVIIFISYGVAWWINDMMLGSLDDKLMIQGKGKAEVERDTRSFNTLVQAMNTRITSNHRWAIHIQDVLDAVPPGVAVMKFELTENPSVLIVTGKANSGDLAVKYQNLLSKLHWVDHVDAPLQNFARSPDAVVTFTVFRKDDNGGVL